MKKTLNMTSLEACNVTGLEKNGGYDRTTVPNLWRFENFGDRMMHYLKMTRQDDWQIQLSLFCSFPKPCKLTTGHYPANFKVTSGLKALYQAWE